MVILGDLVIKSPRGHFIEPEPIAEILQGLQGHWRDCSSGQSRWSYDGPRVEKALKGAASWCVENKAHLFSIRGSPLGVGMLLICGLGSLTSSGSLRQVGSDDQ